MTTREDLRKEIDQLQQEMSQHKIRLVSAFADTDEASDNGLLIHPDDLSFSSKFMEPQDNDQEDQA